MPTSLLASPGTSRIPGVYLEDGRRTPPAPFETGIPVFLGNGGGRLDAGGRPTRIERHDFEAAFLRASRGPGRAPLPEPPEPLVQALCAFFDNGGSHCWVVSCARQPGEDVAGALRRGLEVAAVLEGVDLVLTPDVAAGKPVLGELVRQQSLVLDHCAQLGNRFALLEAPCGAGLEDVLEQCRVLAEPVPGRSRPLANAYGALYYPWLKRRDDRAAGPAAFIAGLLARGDREPGHPPGAANVALAGVVDVAAALDRDALARLAGAGANPLVARPGRGVRAWGARTLSREPAWESVHMRRTLITLQRWLELRVEGLVFEPDDPFLRPRVHRQVSGYLEELYRRGALAGKPAADAFDVRCDPHPGAGQVMTEIGLRPVGHLERIVVRLVLDDTGFHLGVPT